jgi:photoactive yellow protein
MMSFTGASSPKLQTVARLKEEIRERLQQIAEIESELREQKHDAVIHVKDALASLSKELLAYISAPFLSSDRLNEEDFLSVPSKDRFATSDVLPSFSLAHSNMNPSTSYPRFADGQGSFHIAPTPPVMPVPREFIEGTLGVGLPPEQVFQGTPQTPPPPLSSMNVDVGLVNRLSPEELDQLPYGVIQLDARGRVVGYNDTESRMVGLPKERVIGKNFFQEVAPCTRVKEFEGRFRDMAEGRSKNVVEQFEFVFHFRKGSQRVVIMIFRARQRGLFNISLIRR